MNILITDMNSVERHLYFDEPYILVSIRSHGSEAVKPTPTDYNRLDTLFMEFDDCSLEEAEYVARDMENSPYKYERTGELGFKLYPMTLEQAHEIWDFIDKFYPEKVTNVLFQCEAGISRSSGTAAGVLQALSLDNSVCYGPRYHPNVHVKSTIMRAKRERTLE